MSLHGYKGYMKHKYCIIPTADLLPEATSIYYRGQQSLFVNRTLNPCGSRSIKQCWMKWQLFPQIWSYFQIVYKHKNHVCYKGSWTHPYNGMLNKKSKKQHFIKNQKKKLCIKFHTGSLIFFWNFIEKRS